MGVDEKELIVVTGAARGVGHATARSLALDHGRRVLAVSRNERALEELRDECEGKVEILIADLSREDTPAAIRKVVAERRVIGLVHNAGLFHSSPIGDHERGQLEKVFLINALVPLMITQALIDRMKGDPSSHIVHISSMGGFQDSVKFPGLIGYSASKAAMACMAQCLAEEFKDMGIRSNCLALGSVDTEMLRQAFPGFKAGATAEGMGAYVARFVLEGHTLYNGKVLPVAVTTP